MRTDRTSGPVTVARWIALLLPAFLLGGAWIGQLFFGLVPCEMCHWQRWPHYAALVAALIAFVVPHRPARLALVTLAGVMIALSGAIGVFHAGIEWHWWNGITPCTAEVKPGPDFLKQLMAAPVIRCDVAQWRFLGLSLAGWNALFSLAGAVTILTFVRRPAR